MHRQHDFKCKVPVQIRFGDIDGQGHVNNAVYQNYYDIGRVKYLSEMLGEPYMPGGKSLVVASVKTDFLAPVFLHDDIIVESAVIKIGNKSLTMLQRIKENQTGEIKSDCTTIFAGYDYDRAETIVIPDRYRNAIKEYQNKEV